MQLLRCFQKLEYVCYWHLRSAESAAVWIPAMKVIHARAPHMGLGCMKNLRKQSLQVRLFHMLLVWLVVYFSCHKTSSFPCWCLVSGRSTSCKYESTGCKCKTLSWFLTMLQNPWITLRGAEYFLLEDYLTFLLLVLACAVSFCFLLQVIAVNAEIWTFYSLFYRLSKDTG